MTAMNDAIRTVLQSYQNLKLKNKLLIFVSFIMSLSLILMLIGLQYAFYIYDEQIYQKSSQVLTISSNSIEEKLQKIEEVSFTILADSKIQSSLTSLKGGIQDYEQYRMQKELWDKLTSYIGFEKYVHSIHLFDTNGTQYAAGVNPKAVSEAERQEMMYSAINGRGGSVWITPDESDVFLTLVRQIRSYNNLNLESLGMIIIRVDLEKIVNDLPENGEEAAGNFMISSGQQVFFSKKPLQNREQFDFSPAKGQGYEIQKIGSQRLFSTHIRSSYADWIYWNTIPFDVMFAKVTAVKYSLIVLFILLFLVVISLGFKVTRRITNPIEELVSAMKHVQQGDFQIVSSLSTPPSHEDEVGILHRNFTTMIKRINELITENYEKQLLIKETEFKALQAQINPHFLYNTLESINWLAKSHKQKQISNMVEALGCLLQNSISMKTAVIPVEKEVEIVSSYITIQAYRFEERLNFHMNIPAHIKQCSIPKLTIQPLIENAIHYALEPSIEPCMITVTAFQVDEYVYITVEDNGPGMDESLLERMKAGTVKTRGNGIGLQNIDERIKRSFGEQYGLRIQSQPGKGTAVTIILPYETEV